ncbi:hypothetical protein [Sabulibacter ruber]|uniref:hypothetical protein n=1 Tax=Sabulibacter ruber TaxID=2811901 RepID=UPI001A963011|nr:hypothetical protein [Sabulibacter ruber]
MENYLLGISWDPFEGIPGIYVANHHKRGYRYFSTYNNAVSKKHTIFSRLAEGGMIENKGDWDWHHVVEGNHLAPLVPPDKFNNLYNKEWPTVLIHSKEEHKVLNSLLRSKGTLDGLNKNGGKPLRSDERTVYIRRLYHRYQDIYIGDPVLQKVAHNVIRGFV